MLGEILTRHGSDKDAPGGHSYGPVYEELFSPVRETVRNVLEVGVQWGASLKAWAEYFPNARILGLDISSSLWEGDRYKSVRCDSTDRKQLDDVLEDLTFDIVIDDGSHWVDDQVKTFQHLKHRLNPGGIYVVEDIQHIEFADRFTALKMKMYDLRPAKGRFDDILAVFRKPV